MLVLLFPRVFSGFKGAGRSIVNVAAVFLSLVAAVIASVGGLFILLCFWVYMIFLCRMAGVTRKILVYVLVVAGRDVFFTADGLRFAIVIRYIGLASVFHDVFNYRDWKNRASGQGLERKFSPSLV